MGTRFVAPLIFTLAIGCGAGNQSQGDASRPDTATGADASGHDAGDIVAIPVTDGGGGIACLTDSECDDGNPCQTHRCAVNGEIGQCEYTSVSDGASCGAGLMCGGSCMAGVCFAQTCDMDAGTTPTDSGTTPMDSGNPPTDSGIIGQFDAGGGRDGSRRDGSIDRDTGGGTDSGMTTVDAGPPHTEIDPVCPGTCPYDAITPVFPPFSTLVPSSLPATCSNGFELGNPTGGCTDSTYTLHASRAGGARAVTLEIDFATYTIPDGVTITGIDSRGRRYTLFESCRLKTWTQPFTMNVRPPDVAIRQYRVDVLPGTTQLDFDYGPVTTPTYMKVLGLCDFNVTPFAGVRWFATVP